MGGIAEAEREAKERARLEEETAREEARRREEERQARVQAEREEAERRVQEAAEAAAAAEAKMMQALAATAAETKQEAYRRSSANYDMYVPASSCDASLIEHVARANAHASVDRVCARVCAHSRISATRFGGGVRPARRARRRRRRRRRRRTAAYVFAHACQLDYWLSVDSNCTCGCVQFVVHAYVQRKLAKERLAKAMAAPEEDREWIKDVNEHASNAESLKVKVMNEKRPDVLSFRSVPREEINLRSQRRACARG